MYKLKENISYLIALLCAGFACTQDVFKAMLDMIGSLSMKLNYGWFTILLMVVLIVWGSYLIKVNWQKYNYGKTFTATLIFFVTTTLYYRFINEDYEFVSFVGNVTYVDILWLFAIVFISEVIANKKMKETISCKKNSAILLDAPISTPEEDKFDFYSEAKHIADTLSQLPEDKSVSVAILSPWGNGKTSFVNLIKHAIKNGDSGKHLFEHIIIEFNPRKSRDISSIQEEFFKTLIDAIPNELRFRHKVSNYIENIGLQDVHQLGKIFAGIVKGSKEDSANEVNEVLDYLGKRLIIFIDDFDRLTDVEIIEVLKLIDNNAAFRHTIFITAYDDDAVSKALKKYESANGIAYIDKFFTLRFHLPLRSDVSIINEVYQILLKEIEKSIELQPIIDRNFKKIAECIRNLRDVKNFCNMFQIDYAFNSRQKINYEEYFLLELMKFRYYDDYCNLYKKTYVENNSLFRRADALYSLKAEYSENTPDEAMKGNQPRSIKILRSIFANHKSPNDYGYRTEKPAYRSVQYVRYFDMYFTNRSYGHVQAERLESIYTMNSNKEIKTFYEQCIQQKAQNDIVDFLRNQDWQDITPKGNMTKEETFKKFARLVFLYSAITDNNDTYIDALQLQLTYKPNFADKGYNDMDEHTYHDYLLNVIYNHDDTEYIPLAFLMKITHTLISPTVEKGMADDGFILNSEEVKKNNIELLKKYVETQQEYTTRLSYIYSLCLERIENNRLIIMQKANVIVRDFLNKDKSNEYLNNFIIFQKQNDHFIRVVIKDVFFNQIFPFNEENDSFEVYVKKSLSEGDISRDELLAYLKRYRKASSNSSGYYTVKEDNLNPSNMEIIEGLEF